MRYATAMRWMWLVVLGGCGPVMSSGADAGRGPLSVTTIDAGCAVRIEAWPLGAGIHVDIGSEIAWPSNPPQSGTHYPAWAAFQEFSTPVPRGYYVHDLEHGAVVLLHHCALAGVDCTPTLEALRQAVASLPDDPRCSAGVRVRTVITPDPLITEPIVAVSWGFVYRAQCVDLPSLQDFMRSHYAHAPEDECANGVTRF